jgi:hypothetical protein
MVGPIPVTECARRVHAACVLPQVGMMRIVHRSDLISLPTFGNRDPLVTWDELIAALQAFDGIDRDNDGVGDPPFCVLSPSSYDATGREQMSMMRGPLHHLFEYIASSILQVRAPRDGSACSPPRHPASRSM